ncbi:MAG: hypothetical protein Q4E09_04725 [Eubacteriales bacterium]|nr:hypothetical protein [Eubacteriales bacterium]
MRDLIDANLCLACGQDLRDNGVPYWARPRTAGPGDLLAETRRWLCPSCLARLPYLEGNWSYLPYSQVPYAPVFDFAGPARELILGLKFSGKKAAAQVLAAFAVQKLQTLAYAPDYLVALPLHPMRERWRSYNQAQLITHAMAEYLDCSCLENLLIRTRDTATQSSLNGFKARFRNLEGAFALSEDPGRRLQGAKLLLIDDVLTSGASCLNASRALLTSGAQVRVLCMAEQAWEPARDF